MSETCGDNGGVNNSGEPCGRKAGHGTDHLGEGRCMDHEVDMKKKHGISTDEVQSLAAAGLPIHSEQAPDITDFYGICEDTWHNICNKDESVRRAYRRGQSQASANVGKSLYQRAKNGDIQAMKFYLKCQAGWKPTEKHEITGEDGEPVEVEGFVELPDPDGD